MFELYVHTRALYSHMKALNMILARQDCSSGQSRVTKRVCAIVLIDACMKTLMSLTKCVNVTVQI